MLGLRIIGPASDSNPEKIDYVAEVKNKIAGPSDPLAGPTSPDDMAGLVNEGDPILSVLKKILIAVRATHATMPIAVVGSTNFIPANDGARYRFEINGKPIPALKTFIQNLSGQDIWISIDKEPSPMGIKLATASILQISDVDVHTLGIYCTNQTYVNGIANPNHFPTSGEIAAQVTIIAWSNPEWYNVWGETA